MRVDILSATFWPWYPVPLIGDESLGEGGHPAIVKVTLKGGRVVTEEMESFRGKAENPMSTEEVEKKARNLRALLSA